MFHSIEINITFDATETDIEDFTADVSFKYTWIYEMQQIYDERKKGASLDKNASEMGKRILKSTTIIYIQNPQISPLFMQNTLNCITLSFSLSLKPEHQRKNITDTNDKNTYYEVTDLMRQNPL